MLQLGKAIKLVRAARGKSLADVATVSGIGIPFLSLIEAGQRQPSLATLRHVADALGIPSELLIIVAANGQGSLRSEDELVARLADALTRVAAAEEELKLRLEEKPA